MSKRINLIVLDSVGCGNAKDARVFDDEGSNTLLHIIEKTSVKLPHLEELGLGNIVDSTKLSKKNLKTSYIGRLNEQSAGKDSMTGHWELMGVVSKDALDVYPDGFPQQLIDQIEKFSGRKVLCNKPYSGTEVINDYGKEQMETGSLILYTSADSVLQIAAHTSIIPLQELYRICEFARSITKEKPLLVGRIIARPYVGKPGAFTRTYDRHDYSLTPPVSTTLNILSEQGKKVIAIGKINDLFNGSGISETHYTKNNKDGIEQLLQVMEQDFDGLSFTNLVDFDVEFGHRRNPEGYAKALEYFDAQLPRIYEKLGAEDILIITADHGNDPTFKGTDHTREQVPFIICSKSFHSGGLLQESNFSSVGSTIEDLFDIPQKNSELSLKQYLI